MAISAVTGFPPTFRDTFLVPGRALSFGIADAIQVVSLEAAVDGMADPSGFPLSIPPSDGGDDTQLRFRAQAAFAARLALDLLSSANGSAELYCETIEDVLVKRLDGKFVAVQVKTRKTGAAPFKASDEEILGAVSRFCSHEKAEPHRIWRYVIAVNVGFWQEVKNGSNLPFLTSLAKEGAEKKKDDEGFLSAYCVRVGKVDGADEATVMNVLRKLQLDPSVSRLENLDQDLVHFLAQVPGLAAKSYPDLLAAANALIAECLKAASATGGTHALEYIRFSQAPEQVLELQKISAKRIAPAMVTATIERAVLPDALLKSWRHVPPSQLPKGMHVMEKKLAAAGISHANVELAKDHRVSTESLLVRWLYKYGPERSDDLYQNLRVVVRTECQEAFDAASKQAGLFGGEMLEEARRLLRARQSDHPETRPGCQYEHLLGMAAILTEACEIWWTEPFVLEETGDAE